MRAQDLTPAERAQVLAHVRIVDLTGRPFRVVEIARDVVQPDRKALAWLVALLQEFAPDWLVLDPAVSLGVGESRVNDAEQGLIESTRVLIAAFDCCVQLVHHSGKAGFREGTTDQYAGRGGSALADGARMVAVLVHVDAADWLKATGTPLAPDESGLALHLPKLSFCPHAPAIYIRRKGWHITHQVVVQPQTPQDANAARAAALLAFLRAEIAQGRRYNAAELDTCAEVLQWSRGELRAARGRLEASGQLAPIGGSGKRGAYLQPVEAMPPPGLACPEGGEFV
jgi:RecA-family ATPase